MTVQSHDQANATLQGVGRAVSSPHNTPTASMDTAYNGSIYIEDIQHEGLYHYGEVERVPSIGEDKSVLDKGWVRIVLAEV